MIVLTFHVTFTIRVRYLGIWTEGARNLPIGGRPALPPDLWAAPSVTAIFKNNNISLIQRKRITRRGEVHALVTSRCLVLQLSAAAAAAFSCDKWKRSGPWSAFYEEPGQGGQNSKAPLIYLPHSPVREEGKGQGRKI